MQILTNRTVRDIALEMPVTTRVFEEFKIDYCCGGRRPFEEACQIAGADPDVVSRKIEEVVSAGSGSEVSWLNTASLRSVIGYICDKHHVYTRAEIAALGPLMAKVSNRHGENHPELIVLEGHLGALCEDLLQHLAKEENVLFPYIEDLERAKSGSAAVPLSCFGTVQNPVNMMLREHDAAGDLLREMRGTANDYQLPEGACPSYAALFSRLEAFELDLHQHIHLENNLLFPKAIVLESEVVGSSSSR